MGESTQIMVNINCGNCGATHSSVAEVKQCHTTSPSAMPTDEHRIEPDDSDFFAASTGRPSTTGVSLGPTPAGPGPDVLGRSVLVTPGQPTPAGWSRARRVLVDTADVGADLIDDLHRAWAHRERLVIEISGDVPEPTVITDTALWNLSPSLDLTDDRLAFLLTANTVDHRSATPDWPLVAQAITHGAEIADAISGDVVLPDGTIVWLDGGPFEGTTVGNTTVLHSTQIACGHLPTPTFSPEAAELAPDQLEAVEHRSGPARIIAPAGSGKTRVLTERARHLLRDRGFPAQALTLVAFNKRAQLEMEERTTDLVGLRVRTLNALGLAIIRGTAPFIRSSQVEGSVEVMTEFQVRRILDSLLDLRRRANVDQLASWLDALTAVRLGLRDPDEVESSFGGDIDGLADLVRRYRSELQRRGVVDFDEQIVRAIEILLADPLARAVAQRSCRTMLVDEFQDLTPAHMLLVRILSAPAFDVFGVGDDDQTIYGFTGATPDWLINFKRWFPEAEHHALEVNYRCPPAVVEAAATLLTHNRHRVEKLITPSPTRQSAPTDLQVLHAADTVERTCHHVRDLVSSGVSPADVIVLTRVNAALAPIQVALGMTDIPVEHAVGELFLSRSGVGAVLAWLRLAAGGGRFTAPDIAAAARRPSRSVSPRVVEWMSEQRDLNSLRRLARRLKDRDADKVDGFADDIETLMDATDTQASTEELIQIIGDDIGLAGSLDVLDSSRNTVDRSSHSDDLAAVLALGRLEPDPVRFEPWLRNQLTSPGDPDGVNLSTVHRVKGREWPHVLVTGVDAGRFPHRLNTDVEEERRVFHVAITRSEISTTVVTTTSEESPFIAQLHERHDPSARPAGVKASPAAPTPSPAQTSADDGPREHLKNWRRERSKTDGVPAYVVFNDKTLDDLLLRCPTDLSELAQCHGIGPAKLERYGDELLGVLSDALA